MESPVSLLNAVAAFLSYQSRGRQKGVSVLPFPCPTPRIVREAARRGYPIKGPTIVVAGRGCIWNVTVLSESRECIRISLELEVPECSRRYRKLSTPRSAFWRSLDWLQSEA